MSLDAIVARIEADSVAEAEALLTAARQEEEKALAAAGIAVEEKESRERERVQARLTELRRRLELHARREAERAVEHARRRLIDQAIAGAVEQLAGLPDDEYRRLIAAILKHSTLSGRVQVGVTERDRERLTDQFLAGCSTGERSFEFAPEHHREPGGVMLRSGRVAENATLTMWARLLHEELAMELAALLAKG